MIGLGKKDKRRGKEEEGERSQAFMYPNISMDPTPAKRKENTGLEEKKKPLSARRVNQKPSMWRGY